MATSGDFFMAMDIGCVSAACLAARGHAVIGVDANPDKTGYMGIGW